MSHFCVIVIGEDAEKQLAPFHEFECTGHNDEFVQDIDITQQAKEEFEKSRSDFENIKEFLDDWYGISILAHGEEPDLSDTHKYGYAILDENGEVTKVIDRTNPNKKWDWYIVGGRFQGHLKLKPGATGENGRPSLMGLASGQKMAGEGFADVAKKGDVDIDVMREAAETKARLKWEKAIDAAVKASGKSTWETWESVRSRISDVDEARKTYHAQPEVEAINKAFSDEWFLKVDEFLAPGDEYVKRAGDGALVTFAVLKDGKWYERGEMGWWACVSNEKSNDEWNSEFAKLIESLPDDTLLTIVDCHI